MSALSSLLMCLPDVRTIMQGSMQMMPEMFQDTYEMMLAIPVAYYAASAILFALALAGAVLMWRLRGMGFHYYTIAKLLLIGTPLVFIGRQYLNIGDLMMSVLFIVFYYLTLRSLEVFSNHKKSEPEEGEQTPDNGEQA